MTMQTILYTLFVASNGLAILLLLISYVLNIIARVKKSRLSTARIVFPEFSEQHTLVSYCYWCATLFAFLNWLLCTSKVLHTDGSSYNPLTAQLVVFAAIWSVMIFVGIVAEIVIRCFKYSGSPNYSVLAGVKSSIWYAIWCFVLAFLFS